MKAKKFISLGIGLLALMALLTACEKDQKDQPLSDNVKTQALVDAYMDEAYSDADMAMTSTQQSGYNNQQHGPGQGGGISGQRIISVSVGEGESDFAGFPKIITIQFIDWETHSGRIRNGYIHIWANGPARANGVTRIITFEDYTIDGNLFQGTKTISNLDGINFSITMEGGKITFADGSFITREMSHNRQWVVGMDTPFLHWDDEFLITGIATGTNRDGLQYSHTITQALHKKMNCRWFVAGIIEMIHGDNQVILDYGDGNCDNIATITVDGQTLEITLPRHPRQGH